ncbi:DNA-3-methyladenine glycosylase [Candidatus Falkowbacteria bacterium]|nr:DNA-3-methyladenine glycosylase [Candidatus Falkowbacteria bacterium]
MGVKILKKDFFKRPTLIVAKELIGKYLVKKVDGKEMALMITEVEAYDGPRDKASHASRGMTDRNAIMFAEGGYIYVYLCYGMYNMLNFVTGEKDYPAAILIRGVEGFDGPGKLTRHLKIDRSFNKMEICPKSGLWVEDRGEVIAKKDIIRTPRIGVDYAGEIWKNKPYRFVLKT